MSSCPNCGAPARGRECAYCGTPFVEPTLEMAIGKVIDVSFEHDGTTYEFSMLVESLSIDDSPHLEEMHTWAGDILYVRTNPECEATFKGSVVPTSKDGRDCFIVVKQMTA